VRRRPRGHRRGTGGWRRWWRPSWRIRQQTNPRCVGSESFGRSGPSLRGGGRRWVRAADPDFYHPSRRGPDHPGPVIPWIAPQKKSTRNCSRPCLYECVSIQFVYGAPPNQTVQVCSFPDHLHPFCVASVPAAGPTALRQPSLPPRTRRFAGVCFHIVRIMEGGFRLLPHTSQGSPSQIPPF